MTGLTFDDWAIYGMKQGWCGPPVCATHDGVPMSNDEYEEACELDLCVHVIRLYSDEKAKAAVEADHSPSVWRRGGWGV